MESKLRGSSPRSASTGSTNSPSSRPSDATMEWVLSHGSRSLEERGLCDGKQAGSFADMAHAPTEIYFEDARRPDRHLTNGVDSRADSTSGSSPPSATQSCSQPRCCDRDSLSNTTTAVSAGGLEPPCCEHVRPLGEPHGVEHGGDCAVHNNPGVEDSRSHVADDVVDDAEVRSYEESDIGLPCSAASISQSVACPGSRMSLLRKQADRDTATRILHDESAASVPPFLATAIHELILRPLFPAPWVLLRRRQTLERVCTCCTQALRLAGIHSTILFYVFGSVHLRTVLPDGDIDITIVLHDDSSSTATVGNATVDSFLASPGGRVPPPSPTPSTTAESPPTTMPSRSMTPTATASHSSSSIAHTEPLQRIRDYLHANPALGVFVDSLVFAEVRVLKLVCAGLSMDITVDQTGGMSTVCFLHAVDQKFGRQHLFKRTLILLKAWANYEARILGGQGGYLGTYALTTMLIAVMNHVLRGTPAADVPITPPWLMLQFFAYYSIFDFDKYCVTVYGPMPLHLLHGGGAVANAATSSAASDECVSSEADDGRMSATSEGAPWEPGTLCVTEDFVADCTKQFGRGRNAEAAACTPPAGTPVHAKTFPKAPGVLDSLQRGSASSSAGGPTAADDSTASSSSSSGYSEATQRITKPALLSSGAKVATSATWIPHAVSNFPVRNMNVMDPLRVNSNLSRGVSRAHLMRIQGAMVQGMHSFCCALNATSGRAAYGGANTETLGDVVQELFPNSWELIQDLHLYEYAPQADLVRETDLPEVVFGGITTCRVCSEPSLFCVNEEHMRQPEFVSPGSASLLSPAHLPPHLLVSGVGTPTTAGAPRYNTGPTRSTAGYAQYQQHQLQQPMLSSYAPMQPDGRGNPRNIFSGASAPRRSGQPAVPTYYGNPALAAAKPPRSAVTASGAQALPSHHRGGALPGAANDAATGTAPFVGIEAPMSSSRTNPFPTHATAEASAATRYGGDVRGSYPGARVHHAAAVAPDVSGSHAAATVVSVGYAAHAEHSLSPQGVGPCSPSAAVGGGGLGNVRVGAAQPTSTPATGAPGGSARDETDASDKAKRGPAKKRQKKKLAAAPTVVEAVPPPLTHEHFPALPS